MKFQLASHNYPNYYPDNAYVLWTFQYADDMDNTDVVYLVEFGYVRLGYNDVLIIGHGWNGYNSTKSSDIIVSHRGYYNGFLDNILISAGDIFVEFFCDSYSERQGFQLNIQVANISGNIQRASKETSIH